MLRDRRFLVFLVVMVVTVVTGITVVLAVITGFGIGYRAPVDPIAAPSDFVSPAQVPSLASTAPTGESTQTQLRTRLLEILSILGDYWITCDKAHLHESPSLFQQTIMPDDYHRRSVGDLSLLFKALGRAGDVVLEAQESKIGGSFWFDVQHIVHDILEETARSNGYDTTSILRRPVEKLGDALASLGHNPSSRIVSSFLLPIHRHQQSLDTHLLGVRARATENAIVDLQRELPEFSRSARGRLEIGWYYMSATSTWWIYAYGIVLPGDDNQGGAVFAQQRSILNRNRLCENVID